MTSISNNNIQHRETFGGYVTGVAAGGVAGLGTYAATNSIRMKFLKPAMTSVSQFPDEFLRAGESIIKDKNLGIKIGGPEALPEKVNVKGFWKLFENFLNNMRKQTIETIKRGENACFDPAQKLIAVNKELHISPLFHEMGHVINRTSKFWRKMQNLRLVSLLAPLGLFVATMLTPKKTEEQKEKQGILGKITTFMKENAGKLTALTLLPVLAEETRASIVGNGLAKQYLSGDALKSALKANKLSVLGYASLVGVVGLTTYVANKIRDIVAKDVSA